MNKLIIKKLLTLTALATLASGAFAASPNQPSAGGGNCPPGTIPVLDNGLVDCVEATIQQQGNTGMSSSRAGSSYKAVKKPGRAKPDLVVHSVEKHNTDSKKLTVHIENQGNSISKGGKVRVKLSSGQTATASMPDINAGQMRLVYLNFRTDVKSGRVNVMADSNKQVNESKENNNTLVASI